MKQSNKMNSFSSQGRLYRSEEDNRGDFNYQQNIDHSSLIPIPIDESSQSIMNPNSQESEERNSNSRFIRGQNTELQDSKNSSSSSDQSQQEEVKIPPCQESYQQNPLYDRYCGPPMPNLGRPRQFKKATLQNTKIHAVIFMKGTNKVFKTQNLNGSRCPCCDKCLVRYIQEGEKFPLSEVEGLKTLGISFPQYFRLVKYLIIMLLFIFIGCFICMVLNSASQDESIEKDCKKKYEDNDGQQEQNDSEEQNGQQEQTGLQESKAQNCEDNSMMKSINPGHIEKQFLLAQQIIHFVQILALILAFELYFNKRMKKECVTMVVDIEKVADYTVMVTNLPDPYWVQTTREHKGLRPYMENALNQQGQRGIKAYVEQVVACSDIKNLSILNEEIDKLQSLFYLLNLHEQQNGQQVEFFQRKFLCFQKKLPPLSEVSTQLDQKRKQRDQLLNTLRYDHKKRVAFVSYRNIVDAKKILQQFQKPRFKTICTSKYDHYFQHHSIKVQQAPNPSDIFWSNLTIEKEIKRNRRIGVFFLIVFILIVTAVIVGGLSTLHIQYDESGQMKQGVQQVDQTNVAVSINISIAILFFNLGLEVVMDMITHMQLHDTWTNHKISVAQKLTALMFLNTAAIPTWVLTDYTVEEQYENPHIHWFSDNGLVNEAYAILIINALGPPIFFFYWFNILYWVNRLWAKAWEKWVQRKDEIYSQNRVNQECAVFEMDLAERYAQSLKSFCAALFFAPLVPLGVLISAAGLFLEYWISKYMLLRVLSKPREYNQSLAISMNNWIRFGILCYACGVIYFNFYLDFYINFFDDPDEENMSGFIMLILLGGLALGYSISSTFQLIPDSIHKQVRDSLELKFESRQRQPVYYSTFRIGKNTDYYRENPVIAENIHHDIQQYSLDMRTLNYFQRYPVSPPSQYDGRI